MKTLTLTAKDFTDRNGRNEYTGKTDVANYDGNIEIEGDLGYLWFRNLRATGHISIEAGSFIKAGESINAGESIEAGSFIKAGMGIVAGLAVTCTLALVATNNVFAGTATWKQAEGADATVTCGEFRGGAVAYGTLVEIGIPGELGTVDMSEIKARIAAAEAELAAAREQLAKVGA